MSKRCVIIRFGITLSNEQIWKVKLVILMLLSCIQQNILVNDPKTVGRVKPQFGLSNFTTVISLSNTKKGSTDNEGST